MKRILLIDDEKDFRDGMKVLLEIYGYEVRIAENGSAGYCLRAETNFDLIITDILMPEMDGLELILKVRSVSPNAKIIAISGGGKGLMLLTILNYRFHWEPIVLSGNLFKCLSFWIRSRSFYPIEFWIKSHSA